MANLKDIKNRIASVQNTKKITKAMKMVAAAKVKKAETTVKAARPFSDELLHLFRKMLSTVSEYSSQGLKVERALDNYDELIKPREVKAEGLLVITSNKGLAGSYNANVIKAAFKRIKENKENGIKTYVYPVGLKAMSVFKNKQNEDFVLKNGYMAIANNPTATGATVIAEDLAEDFVKGELVKVEKDTEHEIDPLMVFEPSPHAILQQLVPMYITNSIYQALLEANASELAARMTAMSAASNNAEEMITSLTVDYNKVRQSAITNELVEIVSGANSVNK